jgi:diadenosine tetraphosphatase ApaH/serine/threonine PP2A family protein phosphatase
VDVISEYAARGAVVVRGNHDAAVLAGETDTMRDVAAAAVDWTRGKLDPRQLAFLHSLPLTVRDGEILYVHASAELPDQWIYVSDEYQAARSLAASGGARYVFSGHVHEPTLFYTSAAERPVPFTPVPGKAIPVPVHRRWLAIVGSVGQPRDHNTAASWALLDLEKRTLTFHRVPYDWRSAAAKIRAAGLPEYLAARIERGE